MLFLQELFRVLILLRRQLFHMLHLRVLFSLDAPLHALMLNALFGVAILVGLGLKQLELVLVV